MSLVCLFLKNSWNAFKVLYIKKTLKIKIKIIQKTLMNRKQNLLGHVERLNNAKCAVLSCIKVLMNAFSKTESNEVLNSHKTGTFDN